MAPDAFSSNRETYLSWRYPRISPNFQNCVRCEKDWKDNKDNSLHLVRKCVRIFVLGHYLFLVAHSFPRASLSENCSLFGTDNVRGKISELSKFSALTIAFLAFWLAKGAFLWGNPSSDQWSKICLDPVHQRNRRIHDQRGFAGSFAPWSRQILDHWSELGSTQRNAP